MDYYSVTERNETVTHTTPWKNADDVTLNEGSQTPKATHDAISVEHDNRQIQQRQEGDQWLPKDGKGRDGKDLLNG